MPTLVAGGPDIPTAVLQALEDDNLVFFCGAGVSVPAGLPSFERLVKRIYEAVGESETPEERYAIKTGQLDRALGLLEKRINLGALRRQVNKILTLSDSADLTLHKAIITLGRNSDNLLRLVTTNFDNAFEVAGLLQASDIDSAPRLPVPKRSTWQGLVHLHGRIYPQTAERDDIVLTSADFGTAYLSEGWASRFVTELFRHFTVLFVGYSVDDPVMRYLTDALAAERERGVGFRPSYAFAGTVGRRSNRERIRVQWKSKSVQAVFYDAGHNHIRLRKTLEEWAKMHHLGLQSKHYIIRRHAQEAPIEGIVDDVARRVVWALSESSGAIASEFAKINPAPPLKWLRVFEDPEFKDVGLLSLPTKDQLSAPLVSRGLYASSQPLEPSKTTAKLGEWLCRHLDKPELLDWILERGGWLHPALRQSIRETLVKSAVSGPLLAIWEILSSDSFAAVLSRRSFWRGSYLERLLENPSSAVTRAEIVDTLTPIPRISAKSSLEKEFMSSRNLSRDSIQGLADVELDLAGADANHFVDYVLARSSNREDVLLALANDFTHLLAEAMHWLSLFGRASSRFDQTRYLAPSFGFQAGRRRYNVWVHLLDLAWESFVVSSQQDEFLALAILARWRSLKFPVFRRLILRAATEISVADMSMAVDVLVEDNAQSLWASSTRRETIRFLGLSNILDRVDLDRLLVIIKNGPQEERPSDFTDEDWARYRDHAIWARADKIRCSGAPLDREDLDWLDGLGQRWKFSPSDDQDIDEDGGFTLLPITRSKYSPESMDSFDDEALISQVLKELDDRSGILQDWQQLVHRNPARGVRLLRELARRNEWPSDVWENAFFGLRGSKARFRFRVSWLLRGAPGTLFNKIPRTISQWLDDQGKFLRPQCREAYWIIFESVWQAALQCSAAAEENGVGAAINHPLGILTQSLIRRLSDLRLQRGESIPSELAHYFDQIVSREGGSYVLGRIIIAANLNFVHAVDPIWTRNNLIPRLDWQTSPEALLLWEGYLWNPQLDLDLFQAIKHFLLQGLEHLGRLGGGGKNLIRLLAFVSLEFPDSLSREENLQFLRLLDPKQLSEVGEALRYFLEGAGEQSSTLWKDRVEKWFSSFWPHRLDQKGPEVSLSLAHAAIAAKEEFPGAVAAIRDYLVRGADISGVLFALKDSGYSDRYPEATLSLLDALLPYQETQQLWSYGTYLSDLTTRIKGAWPEAIERPSYRRIEELLEKSKN